MKSRGGRRKDRGDAKRHSPTDDKRAAVREAVMENIACFQDGDRPLGEADVRDIECVHLDEVWGGMGALYEVRILTVDGLELRAVAKLIRMPECSSVGDLRKRDSYQVEANFYDRGHAERLAAAGAACPAPIFVQRGGDGTELLLCMSRLEGAITRSMSGPQTEAALRWLAILHAAYWGPRADEAVAEGGLQPQGSYWYLDTRQEEHRQMPHTGWQGRLHLAARGLDARLKADRCQTIVHGDAKAENMMFVGGRGGMSVSFCDFQYVGKAHPAKDLAYCLLCVSGDLDEAAQVAYLEQYLGFLTPLLEAQGDTAPKLADLRATYGLCVCDLARWMSGWGWHGHEGIMQRRCRATLDAIDGGNMLATEEDYTKAVFAAFPV